MVELVRAIIAFSAGKKCRNFLSIYQKKLPSERLWDEVFFATNANVRHGSDSDQSLLSHERSVNASVHASA